MTLLNKGATRRLKGDLTCSGVTCRSIAALTSSLHRIVAAGEKKIRIDCARIRRADISGMQLLYVWMHCAKLNGVALELVNLSYSLQRLMRKLKLGHCFSGTWRSAQFRRVTLLECAQGSGKGSPACAATSFSPTRSAFAKPGSSPGIGKAY